MRFGKDSTFEYISKNIYDAGNRDGMFVDLYEIIRQDMHVCLRKVPESDREDILQEIVIAAFSKLQRDLSELQLRSEGGRNAWLYTVAMNKINDLYRQKGSRQEDLVEEEYFFDLNVETESDEYSKLIESYEVNPIIVQILCELSTVRTTPEKIMAAMYSKLIINLEECGKFNGKPGETEKRLKGKTLFSIREEMEKDLSRLLERQIPREIFAPIDQKLEAINRDGDRVGNQQFELNVKTITDATNRVFTKVVKVVKR